MTGALRRLHARMCVDFASVMDQQQLLAASTLALPSWVQTLDFHAAVARCDARMDDRAVVDAMELVRAQRRATEMLHAAMANRYELGPEPPQPVRIPNERAPQSIAAAVRLCHGEMLEAYAAHRALQLCDATSMPPAHAGQEFARLCHDAYLAAVWTSAHAEYAVAVDELRAGQASALAEHDAVNELLIPPPDLHSVACASNGPDLTALYERASSPRSCSKASQSLLAIFARVTNAGSRGWESTLSAAIRDSDGAVRVCLHALGICLSGMQPCLHPAARRPWPTRFAIARCWRAGHQHNNVTASCRDLSKRCPIAIKEAMRLQLAVLLAEDTASLEALSAVQQPAGQLNIPPRSTAPASLQAAMHAFAAAGEATVDPANPRAPADALSALLSHESRSRKKARHQQQQQQQASPEAQPKPALAHAHAQAHRAEQQRRLLLVGSSSGGGSGLANGKRRAVSTAIVPVPALPLCVAVPRAQQQLAMAAALCSAVTVVSGLLSACFRAEYTPFWLHSQHHGQRASRLDEAQFRALHTHSPAHNLCALLPSEARLRALRLALSVADSSLLTVQDAMALLGIATPAAAEESAHGGARVEYDDAPETEDAPEEADDAAPARLGGNCTGSSRVVQDAEALVLRLDASDAAMLIEFTRCSALRAHLLAYDLGPRTRAAQAEAVCRRLLLTPRVEEGETAEQAALQRGPEHCTRLFFCSECRRVANACQDGSGKNVPFNELGLSASMLRIDGDLSDGHMRCAKRSSAALRTAVSLEEAADALEVEGRDFGPEERLPPDLRPASIVQAVSTAASTRDAASEVAKLRRDIKNCYEQRDKAVACGDVPLVRVPVLGRALRVFGDWYALCVRCGCLAKLSPAARFGAEPCCMRCDFAMLHGREAAKAAMAVQPKPALPQCRYCGKQQNENGTSRWKAVPAPADSGGANANVPPPLRVCYYCPSHYRPWLANAHREMPTAVIFAHILSRARPMFGAEAVATAPMPRLARKHGRQGSLGGASSSGERSKPRAVGTGARGKRSNLSKRVNTNRRNWVNNRERD